MPSMRKAIGSLPQTFLTHSTDGLHPPSILPGDKAGAQSLGHPSSKQVQLCPPLPPTQVSPYKPLLTPGQAKHTVSSVLFTQLGDVVTAVHESLHTALALRDEACPALAAVSHRDITHAILTTLPQILVSVLSSCGKPRPGVSLSHPESIRPDFR